MKKGFTLIELLAVIVILAIIALIVTPVVLKIIDQSREKTDIRNAEAYLKSATLAIEESNMDESYNPEYCNIIDSGNTLECYDSNKPPKYIEVDTTGNKPESGKIEFKDREIKNVALKMKGEKPVVGSPGNLVLGEISDLDTSTASCFKYIMFSSENQSILDLSFEPVSNCAELLSPFIDNDSQLAQTVCSKSNAIEMSIALGTDSYEEGSSGYIGDSIQNFVKFGIVKQTNYNNTNIIKLVGYDETCTTDLVIPEKILGKTVISIEYDAFYENSFTSVKIPNTIKNIDGCQFRGPQLNSVIVDNKPGNIDLSHAICSSATPSIEYLR